MYHRLVNRIKYSREKNLREIEGYLRPILAKRLEEGIENVDADGESVREFAII
jgi:hypothetical protein